MHGVGPISRAARQFVLASGAEGVSRCCKPTLHISVSVFASKLLMLKLKQETREEFIYMIVHVTVVCVN